MEKFTWETNLKLAEGLLYIKVCKKIYTCNWVAREEKHHIETYAPRRWLKGKKKLYGWTLALGSCLNYRLELPSQSTKVQNALFCCNLKNNRINWVHFQGKSLNSTVIQVYAPTSNAEVEQFYEDLQGLVELTPKQTNKNCHFHHRGLECKRRKSRDTWSNRQV